ncbi:MAG: DUF2238 domain-containing protein [Deltaproteobacteria bacterium]|nr:DUF2238 domain-containing protein [Deltaproteobacteria bacterium]
MKDREPLIILLAAVSAIFISGIKPFDWTTWWLEVFPVIIGLPILIATYRSFPLTQLLYRLLLIHALILMIGGHYTYVRVPIGFWVQEMFNLGRNHYDRLGHFAQGFIPAILARELLLRRSPLVPGKWLFFIVVSICLAFSAFYELIEWWTAMVEGEAAEAFFGTQGDVWDTQWDMFLALIGSIAAQVLLSKSHDKALRIFKRPDIERDVTPHY